MHCNHKGCSKINKLSRFFVHLLVAILVISMVNDIKRHLRGTLSTLELYAEAHVVLTRDDQGQNLVLTGEDGKGGSEGGDQLVIAGHNMGGDQDSKMVMQNAANREGDVVISGKSMIIPGEDGHIVLADSRQQDDRTNGPPMPHNPFMLWMPFMSPRFAYRMMPFFG